MNQKIKEHVDEVTPQQVAEYLRYYVKFHLKPGDLEAVPELRRFIND